MMLEERVRGESEKGDDFAQEHDITDEVGELPPIRASALHFLDVGCQSHEFTPSVAQIVRRSHF
jgi:hypothetical protein